MALISPVYTSLTEMERKFSAVGVRSFADHDQSGASDTDVVEDSINQATEEITMFAGNFYNPTVLATSTLVHRWATTLACFFNCELRGNSPPESLAAEVARIMQLLERVARGELKIPGLAYRADLRPMFSNLKIDRRYAFRQQRVKPNSTNATSAIPSDELAHNVPPTT